MHPRLRAVDVAFARANMARALEARYSPASSAAFRLAAYAQMKPTNAAIRESNTLTALACISLVMHEAANFNIVPCAEDSCEDCGSPKWMHIHVTKGGIFRRQITVLHPGESGRYWMLARAILAITGKMGREEVREALRPIALATRKYRAPRWPRKSGTERSF